LPSYYDDECDKTDASEEHNVPSEVEDDLPLSARAVNQVSPAFELIKDFESNAIIDNFMTNNS
jgi:hypothetical protein